LATDEARSNTLMNKKHTIKRHKNDENDENMGTSKENPKRHDSNNSAFYYFSILVTFWFNFFTDPPATNNDQQRARDDSLLWRPDCIRQNALDK
jgi:hypothetical protein